MHETATPLELKGLISLVSILFGLCGVLISLYFHSQLKHRDERFRDHVKLEDERKQYQDKLLEALSAEDRKIRTEIDHLHDVTTGHNYTLDGLRPILENHTEELKTLNRYLSRFSLILARMDPEADLDHFGG